MWARCVCLCVGYCDIGSYVRLVHVSWFSWAAVLGARV